jgi:hypothetical protein
VTAIVPAARMIDWDIGARPRQQIRLRPQDRENVRAPVEGDLDAGPRRAGDEETGQHLLHFVVGAGLRQGLDAKTDGLRFAFSEGPLVQREESRLLLPGDIGQDAGESRHARNLAQQPPWQTIRVRRSLRQEGLAQGIRQAHSLPSEALGGCSNSRPRRGSDGGLADPEASRSIRRAGRSSGFVAAGVKAVGGITGRYASLALRRVCASCQRPGSTTK